MPSSASSSSAKPGPVAQGCPRPCRGTGYFGRTGVFELLHADAPVREPIARHVALPQIIEPVRRTGLRTLREAAVRLPGP